MDDLKLLSERLDTFLKQTKIITENDVYEALGLLGPAGKILKAAVTFPAMIFARHCYAFLQVGNGATQAKREKIFKQLNHESKIVPNVNEIILEQINKCDSEEKANYLGVLFFRGIGNDLISIEEFIRLSQIIVAAYNNEIDYVITVEDNDIDETGVVIEHLVNIGVLTRVYGEIGFGDTFMMKRKPTWTDDGKKIRAILREVQLLNDK